MAVLLPDPIENLNLETEIEFAEQPTYTWRIDAISKQIRGFFDGQDAMRQAIEIMLSVERFKFSIHSGNFGIELDNLLGNQYGYVSSELKRRIEDAISVDTRILGVVDYTIVSVENGALTVHVEIETVYGVIPVDTEVVIT